MHYLFILFSLLLFSCKNSNNIGNNLARPLEKEQAQALASDSSDSNNYLAEKIIGKNSLFRRRVLNAFVEKTIPSGNRQYLIQPQEELLGFSMQANQLEEYNEKEKTFIKLIVSYDERTEIYFLPRQFPLNETQERLGLVPDSGRVFRWLDRGLQVGANGETFILASVNVDDIVKNDVNFYQSSLSLNQLAQSLKFTLRRGAIAQARISYGVFQQNELIADKIEYTSCTVAGRHHYSGCECSYKIAQASSAFEKLPSPDYSGIGLTIQAANQVLDLQRFNFKRISDGEYTFDFNPEDLAAHNFDLSVDNGFKAMSAREVEGFNYHSYRCGDFRAKTVIQLEKKFEFNLEIQIKGRGYEVLKDVLK